MRTIFLIILAVVVIGGGIFLCKQTSGFTNFDKIFDKIYEQVDKNVPDFPSDLEFNNLLK